MTATIFHNFGFAKQTGFWAIYIKYSVSLEWSVLASSDYAFLFAIRKLLRREHLQLQATHVIFFCNLHENVNIMVNRFNFRDVNFSRRERNA